MWLIRDSRRAAGDRPADDSVLLALRACPQSQLVSLVLSASSSRGRPSIIAGLRDQAGAAHCRIALAETRGVAVRWVDGIVTGSVEDVVAFLTATQALLERCHGRTELAAA